MPVRLPSHLRHLFPSPDAHDKHVNSLTKFLRVTSVLEDLTPPSLTWTILVVAIIHFMFEGV